MTTRKPWTKRDRELADMLSKSFNLLILPSQIKPIRQAAITLHKLYEAECNGCTREKSPLESWTDYGLARIQQMKWVEKRIESVEARIKRQAKELLTKKCSK